MIDRRTLVGSFGSAALVAAFTASAQPNEKVWRVGYVGFALPGVSPESDRLVDALLQVLAANGFVEGRNLMFERRAVAGRHDLIPTAVGELIGLNVDVLVTAGTPATRAAKAATARIPIVMLGVSDPVERGLVTSLAQPGANVTGMADFSTGLIPKELELLKAAAPRTARVAFLQEDDARYFSADMAASLNRRYDSIAQGLGMSRLKVRLDSVQDFESAAATIVRERADALLIDSTATNFSLRKEIAEFAIRRRLPSIMSANMARAGGLLSYGTDYADVFRKVAHYVVKILNGAKPADLPIEQPTKFKLVVNLKTAKAIGLTIPQSLLLRADELIE